MKKHDITPETLSLDLLRKASGHKYVHGHALVVSGGCGRSGAARLAARGALRVGAGLVTLAVPRDGVAEVAAQITALMMRPIGDPGDLVEMLRDDRMNAVCVGPGLSISDRSADAVAMVLAARRPSVLDADALSLIARQRSLFAKLNNHCVLTPHGGEFARLFPDLSERLATDDCFAKSDATAEAAKRAGCVVLFKGEETVVSTPQGIVGVHPAVGRKAAPWLATAGSGDVLAGFIVGLMARGFAPAQAAELAVFLHVECAREFGPGLIAEDLPEMLPAVYCRLLDRRGENTPGTASDVPSIIPSA